MAVLAAQYHTVQWVRPAGMRLTPFVEQTIARGKRQLTTRNGPLYELVSTFLPSKSRRTKDMREDGVENLLTLMTAIVASTDMVTGRVYASDKGKRVIATWGVLDLRAYGAPVPERRSSRRTQRHAQTLTRAGLIDVCARPGKMQDDGTYTAKAAVKTLTDTFWRSLDLLSERHKEIDRKLRAAGQQTAAEISAIAPKSEGADTPTSERADAHSRPSDAEFARMRAAFKTEPT